jgi:hypothetical protein
MKRDLHEWRYGVDFLERLLALDGQFMPSSIGAPAVPFVDIASSEKHWGGTAVYRPTNQGLIESLWPFVWSRKINPYGYGSVNFAKQTVRGNWVAGYSSVKGEFVPASDPLPFLRWWCQTWDAEAATLHLLGSDEQVRDRFGDFVSPCYMPVGGNILQNQLENICWATFFGPRFAKETNFLKLRDEGFCVEELAGGYLVVMSDHITDVLSDFPAFSRRRVELKAKFRPDLFKIKYELDDPRRLQDDD